MQEWNALSTRLVQGSDANSTPFTTEDPSLQTFFEQLRSEPPSRQLVLALAGLQWMRKLGSTFEHETITSSRVVNTNPEPSLATREILRAALQSRQCDLMVETLVLMKMHNLMLPPELLTDCFTLAEKIPKLQLLVTQLAGERGAWLARQNSAWQYVTNNDPHALHGDALIVLLREQRVNEIDAFFHTLSSLWDALSVKDRQKTLSLFDITPQSSDLAFLQRCQQDRSQGVRQVAGRLRARLEDSAVLSMARTVVESNVSITRRGLLRRSELEVKLPEMFDKAWEVFGVQENLEHITTAGKLGRKSVWLHQWLALLPTRLLIEMLDTEAEDYLSLASKSDYNSLLCSSWAHAALLHNEADALRLVMKHVPDSLLNQWLQTLLPQAYGACREILLEITLSPPTGKIALPLVDIIRAIHDTGQLPTRISPLLLKYLTRDAESVSYSYAGMQQRLNELAFDIDVSQIPEWIAHLEARLPEGLEGCLRWLRIRQQLHQEFSQ